MEQKKELTDEELAEVTGGIVINSKFKDVCQGVNSAYCQECSHLSECVFMQIASMKK